MKMDRKLSQDETANITGHRPLQISVPFFKH